MQEQDRLAVRADLRLTRTENACALRSQLIARRFDVGDLIADVMNAAVWIALEKSGDRGLRAERLEQLDLGVWQRDEDGAHAVLRLRDFFRHLRAKRVSI